MNDYRSDEFLMAAEASGMDQLFPQQQQQQQQRQGQAQAYAPLDILTVPSQHQHQHPQLQQGLRPNLFVNGTSVADSESDNEDEFKSKKQQQRGGNNSGAVGRLPVSIKDIASDEDERLLASEEGKKLSSKERRQLRNKVSARHFRLRRKEYITQLEQLIEQKVTEANTLKAENERLALENKKLADALQGLSLSPASYLSPSPSEEVYTPSMPRQPAATATASAPVVSQQTPLVPEFQDYDVLNMPLTQFDSPASYLSMNLFAGAVEQEQEQQPQQQQQQQQQQQRITPRIANLLPTFNARKDANPNSFDWPLAYSLPGS
ncbi:hypothetical protein BZA70DRAFT_86723 [Myxozyma melibiosi]|uniref:BZIP domain-containing protein n=1 Tax=Myxozyma melibiosi TaxID=54550 RepID=A0ABR1EZ77_9ASCO